MNKHPTSIKLFFIVSLLLHCWCMNAFADNLAPEKLTVGYFDFPPHTFPKNSKQPSAALAYFDKIAQEMGVEVEYKHYPLSRLVFLLDHQRLDAALFLAKTEARTKIFSYPSTPYFTTNSVFVVPSASNLKSAKDIEQKSTLQLAVWEGGFHSSTLAVSKNTLVPLSGNDVAARGIQLVVNGRFDAFFSPDSHAIEYEALTTGQTASIRILPIPGEDIDIYSVFSKKSANLFLKRYESALKKVTAEISYATFLSNYQKNLPHTPEVTPTMNSESSLTQ
ncbi:substrate-binding periplasmic protein [Cellvibrio sp.]|jgi:ABC-type amino acid transport substrate-binding protein